MFSRNRKPAEQPQVNVHDMVALEQEILSFNLSDAPTCTMFTPHELYLFEQGGYKPLQVVFGNVVYSMGLRGLLRSLQRVFLRGEMADFTRMINDARVLARNRMLQRAQELGADTVVGVVITAHEYGDFLEVTVTGTAAKRIGDAMPIDLAVGM